MQGKDYAQLDWARPRVPNRNAERSTSMLPACDDS